MAEITIRPLAATDRDAWTPLWHGYLTFYKATLPEIDAITFGRLTGGEEPMGGFLAFRGRQAARHGQLGAPPHDLEREADLLSAGPVHRAGSRGTGIGRKLIEAVNQMARAKNCYRVYWQTHESNLQAQELYNKVADKSGFMVYRQPLG
jgi:GNAT superfamily N-acetyltransferase